MKHSRAHAHTHPEQQVTTKQTNIYCHLQKADTSLVHNIQCCADKMWEVESEMCSVSCAVCESLALLICSYDYGIGYPTYVYRIYSSEYSIFKLKCGKSHKM